MSGGRPPWSKEHLQAAHAHSSNHRAEIERSALCGCFYCRARYEPSRIDRWLKEGDGTAICPSCGIDSVIGDASGYPISDDAFLDAMHTHWFERVAYVVD